MDDDFEDNSGVNNHMIPFNGPVFVNGIHGKGIFLNGLSYTQKSDPTNSQSLSSNSTFSAWIKPFQITGGGGCNSHNGSSACRVIYFHYNFGVMLGINSDGALIFDLSNNGSSWSQVTNTGAGEVMTEQWVHLAIVVDGSLNEIRYYKDGTQIGTPVSVGSTVHGTPSGDIISLGRNSSWAGGSFIGVIDDMAVWNRALNLAEISRLATP